MGLLVFLPLVLPLTAWPLAQPAAQHLHPRTATWLLTGAAGALALCSTLCLALLMVVGTAQLPGNPLPDAWSDPEVRAALPYDEVAAPRRSPRWRPCSAPPRPPCGALAGSGATVGARSRDWPTGRWWCCRPPNRTLTRCPARAARWPRRGDDGPAVGTRPRRAAGAVRPRAGAPRRTSPPVPDRGAARRLRQPLPAAVVFGRRVRGRALGGRGRGGPGGQSPYGRHGHRQGRPAHPHHSPGLPAATAGPVPRRVAALLSPAPPALVWPPLRTAAGLATWSAAAGTTVSALSSANSAVTLICVLRTATAL